MTWRTTVREEVPPFAQCSLETIYRTSSDIQPPVVLHKYTSSSSSPPGVICSISVQLFLKRNTSLCPVCFSYWRLRFSSSDDNVRITKVCIIIIIISPSLTVHVQIKVGGQRYTG